jgi:uncharacterized protein YjiS (DUF1127 family)
MPVAQSLHRTEQHHGQAEGRLMRIVRVLGERLARPRFLYAGELSPHLLRDIGLMDECMPGQRSRP